MYMYVHVVASEIFGLRHNALPNLDLVFQSRAATLDLFSSAMAYLLNHWTTQKSECSVFCLFLFFVFFCLFTDSPEVNGYLSWESHQTNKIMKIKLCMEPKKKLRFLGDWTLMAGGRSIIIQSYGGTVCYIYTCTFA